MPKSKKVPNSQKLVDYLKDHCQERQWNIDDLAGFLFPEFPDAPDTVREAQRKHAQGAFGRAVLTLFEKELMVIPKARGPHNAIIRWAFATQSLEDKREIAKMLVKQRNTIFNTRIRLEHRKVFLLGKGWFTEEELVAIEEGKQLELLMPKDEDVPGQEKAA